MENLMKERKEQLLAVMGEPSYVPMKQKELAMLLDVPKECREELVEVLDELVAEGKLSLSKRGRYSIPRTQELTGIYSGTARGFGFVTIEGCLYSGRPDRGSHAPGPGADPCGATASG